MSLKGFIKNNAALKKIVHRMLVPKGEARPRLWVRVFVNIFVHKRGKGAKVRSMTRLDVLPFNRFDLGDHSTIEDFSTINNGVGDVVIGNNTLIGMGNVIIGPVTIGNDVILAQHVVMSGLNHEYRDIAMSIHQQNVTTALITIGDECWIAANAVITAGVTIGRHCVVAAGSVVTKDVESYTIVAGNPAKPIKQYDPELKEWVRV